MPSVGRRFIGPMHTTVAKSTATLPDNAAAGSAPYSLLVVPVVALLARHARQPRGPLDR